MKNYNIKQNYCSRDSIEYYNDIDNKDEWQKEVYQYAETIFTENNFESVLDIGTGSGFKLIKHFKNKKTLGIDLPETVKILREKYPDMNWSSEFCAHQGFDLIICSDVIEHLLDPDELLTIIKNSNPQLIIFSTPDRDLLSLEYQNGPPKNVSHIREWSFREFEEYISTHFQILDHFISNYKQKTQIILAKVKT